MANDRNPASPLESARLAIAHLKLDASEDLLRAVLRAAEVSAATLGVTRVGIWMLGPDRTSLVPVRVYDARTKGEVSASLLPLGEWPAYARAIESRRAVVASDARSALETVDLTSHYLLPLGITSMLDAPIFLGGEVWGIVCHEHIGPEREWQRREIDFAISVADMLSALFEQARRLRAEHDLREAERAASKAQRCEMLVRMSAGVGHDFSTILQTITLLTNQAVAEQDAAVRARALQSILEECQRAGRFARRILDFGRVAFGPAAVIDVGVVITAMKEGLEALVGASYPLAVEAEASCLALSDRAELEQVVLNLVTNARDAMPSGGPIRVSVQRRGERIVLEVADQGAGIDPAIMPRIFEPFFTTKTAGEGAGLGLATVRTLVEARNGEVSVVSTVGKGTTFVVSLPSAIDGG